MRTRLLISALLVLVAARLQAQIVYTENSSGQFSAGTHNSTYVSSGAVTLDYYGRASGLSVPGQDIWYGGEFKYRQALTLNSANPSTLTAYPVLLTLNTQALVSAGRMNADGSDLRFTTAAAAGNPQALPYYIESGMNTSATKIWVRHSGVYTGANGLYAYYGSTASAASSSMPGVFLLGDNFGSPNGSSPSTATWVSVESAPPASGSSRSIQSGRLRLLFGSASGTRYYGVRSASQYSFAAGRRYRADLYARTGTDSWSSLTLCPNVYTYSYDQDDWLRFAVHHAPGGASYSLERSDTGSRSTLTSGALADGAHRVELFVSASSFTVLLDGAEIYSAANTLAFNSPYLYLEAGSASAALENFDFDNLSVQPYSYPEPAFGAAGAEEGRRHPSGYFLSQVKDSASSSRYNFANWLDSLPLGSTVTLQVRAHDTNVALASFSPVTKGGDPGVTGRYVQYRADLSASDPRWPVSVSSVTLMYGSAPLAPSGVAGSALSESSIRWAWTDNSSGQYQEDGFKVMDATGTVKGTVGQNVTEWTETGLYANTIYTRTVAGYNAAGTGAGASVSKYTLAVSPNVSCDKSTGTWLSGAVTCINLAGFGANGVTYYRYEWNQQPTKTWSGSEAQWSSGTLSYTPPFTGNYYLHVKSYNGDNLALTGYQSFGPFWYDKNAPSVTGFSPSSAPWQNVFVNPAAFFADTGGSKLWRARYRWTTSADRPATGWQAYNYTISGDSGTISYTQAGAGQWYLHAEVDDVAGNTGWSYAGPFKIDVTKPTGGIIINGGDTYTATPAVTLALTYADSESGVKSLAYKNLGESFTAPDLPQASTTWQLTPGDGSRQVYVQVTDNAGNTQQYTDTINLDSRTTLIGAGTASAASGVMGEPAESFTASAVLSWTPDGSLLSGKTLAFHFAGTTQTAVTDVLGRASANFSAPQASGTYIYNISFSTDGVYAASAATGTLAAGQRTTTVITEDVNATSNSPFIAKATLKDFYTSALITGATVTFTFEGSTLTAVTNGIGVATVTFTAPLTVNFYDYAASYAGSAVYAAQSATSRVGVGLRVTSLVVPSVSALAGDVFTAQATLLDGVTPVQGSTVSFYFQGSTRTAQTDAGGVASSTFTAPASSGTYPVSGYFAGDGTYTASSGAGTLTANRRPLSLAGETAQGYVNATFQARTTLYDGITAARVPGKNIVFVFEGSSATAVTDANGVSTAVFSAGPLARGASCYYYFAGDPSYNNADSTGTVTIERRPVSLAASDVSALLSSSFTATAQLRDMAFGPAALAGKTLFFSYQGSTQSAVTDALGVASVTYQSAASTGTYEYYVSFAQESAYVAASDTGTITLDKRPVILSAYPRFIFALDSLQALADLKDGVTGEFISSQPVSFVFNGASSATMTGSAGGSLGRASAVFAGTGTAGAYSYSATFAGTALYSAASSTASVTVTQRSVNLAAFPVSAIWGTTFTATAEFRDGATNTLISGKQLRLAFSTAPAAFQLTAAGVASSTFSAPASTGSFSWFANFAGDAAYAAAAATGTLTVNRRPATLTPIASSRYVWDSVFLSASFADDGNPVVGRSLSFFFNGSTLTAVTNAGGVATTAAFSSVSVQGVYGFTVQFAGDTNYSAQSGSSTVTVNKRLSNINVGPATGIAGSSVTLSATLVDTNWTTPVSGKTLSFTLQGSTFGLNAVTNASGMASVVFVASSVTGAYAYSATFAGNTNYAGSSSTETLTVSKRPTVLEMADYYPPANSTFTASAVLKDFATGAAIDSRTISFLFRNSTQTAVTSGLGYGATNYVTLASTTSYPISASFAGDTLYAAASIVKTVYPGRRNTSLQTSDILTAVAKDTFTVTARLSDYDLGTFLSGSTITFSFTGSTYTLNAVTNSTGIASVQFAAPSSTGTHTYTAAFAGTSLYNGTMETSSVLVNRRNPALNASDLTGVPAASTFTASAVLSDGTTLSTRTLTFVFTSTRNAVTNGVGVATTSFTAPSSTGTFSYKVTFNGDALYNPATAYATVGVVLKPTVLEVLDVPDAVVGLKFTGTAKLRDIEAGNELVLSTKSITFTFRPFAVTYTSAAVTAAGVSTAAYIAPLSTGTYGYTAVFAGDGVYGPSTSSGTVIVNRRPVLFSVVSDPTSPYAYRANAVNSSFTVTATLSDGQVAGVNLQGRSIRFVFQGVQRVGVTDALGVATATYSSPASSGTYLYQAFFDGDSSYNPNRVEDSDKYFNIVQRPTNILPRDSLTGLLNVDGDPNPYYTFWKIGVQARIIDTLSGQGVLGATAAFVLNGSTITGVSNSIGTAVSSSPFPGYTNYGTYPAVVNFYGDAAYGPSVLPGSTNTGDPYTGKVRIHQSPAYFDVAQITETYPDADTVISGGLLDWWNRPVNYADRIIGNPNGVLVGYPITYQVSTIPCGADCGAVGRNWAITGTGNVTAANIASTTVRSPAAAGDYPIRYFFSATPSFTQWDTGGAQRILRVGRRLTYIIPDAEPFTAGAMLPIDITLKLADLTQSLAGINGKNLEVVLVTTQTLVTGGVGAGKVKATFAGLAVGTYTYIARFADGDPAYMPFTSSGTVIVEKNTTVLSADDAPNVPAGNSFTAKATLVISSGSNNTPLPGKTINFVFTSTAGPTINLSAVTNAIGVATVTYWSPYVPANYNYTASFTEDASNKGSADNSNLVQVVKRRTQTSAENASVYIQETFSSTATLTDLDLSASTVPSKTISFVLHKGPDVSGSAVTNAAGMAWTSFASPVSSGVFQYSATFPGDSLYAVSSDTKTVTVTRRVTFVDTVDITTPTNSLFTISGMLQDVTFNLGVSTPVAGQTLRFVFNGETKTAVTAADGKASVSYTAPAVAGSYGFSANFDGSQTYGNAVTNRTVTVRKRNTFVSGQDLTAPSGAQFTASANLIDEYGEKLEGYTLNFQFTGGGTFNGSGLTDANGQATANFTAPLSTGIFNYTASYAGNDTYEASSDNSNSVTVNIASTTLELPNGSVIVNKTYYSSATLRGAVSGAGIAGKVINFTYPGLTLGQATTDALGEALKLFVPDSTGTFRLDAVFAGDSAFYAASASATITVLRRPTGVSIAQPINTEVGSVFVATITLRDYAVSPSTWVVGRTLDVLFNGGHQYPVTNSNGQAFASFTAPSPGGQTYPVSVTFAGDAIYTSTDNAGIVNVAKRPTAVSVDNGPSMTLEVFNATATLRWNGNPVPGKLIQFTYKGTTLVGPATDAEGKSYQQFSAGSSSGPWKVEASFTDAADPAYAVSAVSSATITVAPRPSVVVPENLAMSVYDTFTATATFRDVRAGTTPSGKAARIAFNWMAANSTFTTTASDGSGLVFLSSGAPASSGTYRVESFYPGDATYAPSLSSTATVTVTRRPSQLSLADAAAIIDRVFTATATLKNNGANLNNKRVVFTFEGRNFNVYTTASGVATATFTVTLATGPTQIDAVFSGDSSYEPSNAATATVTAAMRYTYLVPQAVSVVANKAFVTSATLRDLFTTPIAGQQVAFTFDGATLNGASSAAGLSTAAFTAAVATGAYSVPVEFAGNFKLVPSSTTLAVTVLRRPTSITPLSNVTVNALDVFYATATLRDLDLLTLGARPLRYIFQGSTFAVATDGGGVAVSTWAAPASSGTYKLYSYYDGDPIYGASASTITVTVQQRPSGISLNPISGTALDVFTATATLADLQNPANKLSGRHVAFSFSWGASTGGVSDAVGVATASYQATATAGNYVLTGTFAGDATYASTATTTAFPVIKRNAFVRGVFVSTRVYDVFTASGTFYDAVSSAPVSGRQLKLSLQNVSTQTAVTSGAGVGAAAFTAPASSGTYFLQVWSDGDATYFPTTVYQSSVTLARRASSLTLSAPTQVILASSFTAASTMYDSVNNSTVPSRTLSFVFQAATQTAVTSALGTGTTNYVASLSSGVWQLQVSFAGDASYAPAVSTRAVTALRYPTLLTGPAITVTMNEVLTATATLRDYKANNVAGRQVGFSFAGAPFLDLTDASGVAYSTYAATVASGTYSLPVAFPGDALYDSTSTSLSVLVNKRTGLLAVDPVVVRALDVFTATATLSDLLNPASKLAGETVNFVFTVGASSFSASAAAGADGRAAVQFTAPVSTGAYQLSASFSGNASYYPLLSQGEVTVTARPVLLMQDNVPGVIDEPFRSTATLVDQATLAPVSGRAVSFTFGATLQGTTAGDGKASALFTAPAASGTYLLSSAFAGDATYAAASSTGALTVARRPVLLNAPDIQGIIDETFISSATLSDQLAASAVAGRQLSFYFAGSTVTDATGAGGRGASAFTAPASSGTYYAGIAFAGDSRYLPASTTAQLLVDRRPAGLSADWVLTRAGEVFTATATLTDTLAPASKPAGRVLRFVFNAAPFDVITNAQGVAVSTFLAPASSGTARLDVYFAGDARYAAVTASNTVVVERRLSQIAFDPVTVTALSVFTATATASDKLNPVVPVNGRQLRVTFRGATFGTLTDAAGISVSTFSAPASSGTYEVEAVFDGDPIYEGSTATGTVTVIQRRASLAADDGSAYPFEALVTTAALRDAQTGLPVPGRTLGFTLDGGAAAGVTDALGVATAPFVTPDAFGPYRLDADFPGDATYAALAASATISVMQRPTALAPSDAAGVTLDLFVASATLYDVRLATYVAGREIGFSFNGVSTATLTDASGLALAVFAAPLSSGVYTYAADFAGDSVYAPVTANASVTVETRDTRVVARDKNANVGEPFTLQAQLLDPALEDLPGYYVPNVRMKFVFKDRNNTKLEEGYAYTNELGIATITFSGPGAPDVYYYTAAFEGDMTYSSSTATAMVKVGLLTSLVAFDVETEAMETFTVKAKLTDYLSTTLDDKKIRFRFIGAENSGMTNAAGDSGIAASTFTAPASSGTYFYNAYFDGDAIYSASNSTAIVTVRLRTASLLTYPAAAQAHSSFTVMIALKDLKTDNHVGGRDIDLHFNGSTVAAVTSLEDGTASAIFFAPFSTGTANFTATFRGDDTYSPTVKIGTVTASLRPTTMLSYNVSDLLAGATFQARVQVKDALNQPVQGLSVDLLFEGDFGVAETDGQGYASYVFTAPASSGTYNFNASFFGDSRYSASAATGTVTLGPRPTIVFTSEVSAKLGSPLGLSARLVDVNSQAGVSGKQLSFYFEGSTLTANTDALGVSTVTFPAPPSTGTFSYGAEFVGDGVSYMGSYSSAQVTIALNFTSLEARGGLSIKIYEPLPAEAVLRDNIGLQLPGLPVRFVFEGAESTAATSAVGKATAAFATTLLPSTGTYNYEAYYDGDLNYVSSSDTANSVAVERRESLLIARDALATPNKSVPVQANLYDNVNGSALAGASVPGKTVLWELNLGTWTQTAVSVTDLSGVSTAAFITPASTGTFPVTARFADGDPVYLPAASTAALTVFFDDGTGAIRTKLKVENGEGWIGLQFTASATLTATDLPVPGKAVLFEFFNGVDTFTAAGFTDGSGLSTAPFTAPVSSGVYQLTASFAGDVDYSAATGTGTFTAQRFPDSLTARDATALSGDPFWAKAVLVDTRTGLPVSTKTVVFEFFNGVSTQTLSAVTSSTGLAEVQFTAPLEAGDYFYTARFDGDAEYVPASDTGSMLIASKGSSTFLVGYDVIVGTGEVFAASATLTSKGYPVQGKGIKIDFLAAQRWSTTTVSGLAVSTYAAPASSGVYIYSAYFYGDQSYNAANTTGTVTVVLRETVTEQEKEQPAIQLIEVTTTAATIPLVQVSTASNVAAYKIDQSATLRGGVTVSTTVAVSTYSSVGYTIPLSSSPTFVKVTLNLANDYDEVPTPLIVEIPPVQDAATQKPNYYYMSPENANGSAAWVKIPGQVMEQISPSAPIAITVKPAGTVPAGFEASYEIKAPAAAEKQIQKAASDRRGVEITLAYPTGGTGASAATGQMALYWYNGVEWVKVGGDLDVVNRTISARSRVLGQFALRAEPLSSSFSLTKVAPRIFSPDEASTVINRAYFSYENPSGAEVTIRIYDITGALVRRNLEYGPPNTMFWDGKDQSGAKVRGGVYIYQLECGDKVLTGTVVVAK